MSDEDLKRAYREFVVRQRAASEDGDLDAECTSDEVSGIEDRQAAFRAFLQTEHANDPNLRRKATEWFAGGVKGELWELLRAVGVSPRESQKGDRWTRAMSKSELCRIVRRHCRRVRGKPVGADGKRVGSHANRFFEIWIEGQVDFEQKSSQRFIFNFEHLCSVFGDDEMNRAADELGAD